jgi:iron complex transport system substrate-binding protein
MVNARQLTLAAGSLEGIFSDIGRIAQALALPERGCEVIARERRRFDAVRAKTAGLRRPTVVVIEWTDPLFAMGNWGPELVDIANGELLIGRAGEYSGAVTAEELRAADPEILIVAPCGFSLARAWEDRSVMAAHSGWRELRAVRNGKVAFADGNLFFNRSGMTVAPTAEIIAEILHGMPFAGRTEGVYWNWA